jgi:hypothetical protein
MPAPFLSNRGINGQINERGIESWAVRWWAETPADARTCGDLVFFGFPSRGRVIGPATGEGPESLGYYSTITYEGLSPEAKGVATYQFSPSTSREPMERSPLILELMRDYGGVEQKGKIVFPARAPKKAASDDSGFALSEGASSGDEKNPLFGWEDYQVWGGIWSQTIAYKDIPPDAIDDIWKIVETVPGKMRTPKGRNWMIQPPGISVRGDAVDLSRNWMLSPPGGWPPIISRILRGEKSNAAVSASTDPTITGIVDQGDSFEVTVGVTF